jgi:hypothetical protein
MEVPARTAERYAEGPEKNLPVFFRIQIYSLSRWKLVIQQ